MSMAMAFTKAARPESSFFLVRAAAAVEWTRVQTFFDVYVPSLASGGVWLTRTAQASQKALVTRFVLKTLPPSKESSKTDQDESSRVLRFYVVCESRIEIHPTSGQQHWMKCGTNTDLTKTWTWQLERFHSFGTLYQVLKFRST